jgi:splicing factor U2AF subunit
LIEAAIAGLNGLIILDKALTVRYATTPTGINALVNGVPINQLAALVPTKILKLANMVSSAEVNDDEEYEEILEDVKGECSQYGTVVSLVIPRVKEGFSEQSQGNIFVQFLDEQMAKKGLLSLSGRKFANNIVVVEYYNETKFAEKIYE